MLPILEKFSETPDFRKQYKNLNYLINKLILKLGKKTYYYLKNRILDSISIF